MSLSLTINTTSRIEEQRRTRIEKEEKRKTFVGKYTEFKRDHPL